MKIATSSGADPRRRARTTRKPVNTREVWVVKQTNYYRWDITVGFNLYIFLLLDHPSEVIVYEDSVKIWILWHFGGRKSISSHFPSIGYKILCKQHTGIYWIFQRNLVVFDWLSRIVITRVSMFYDILAFLSSKSNIFIQILLKWDLKTGSFSVEWSAVLNFWRMLLTVLVNES